VRRFSRILLNAATAVSLLLFVAAIVRREARTDVGTYAWSRQLAGPPPATLTLEFDLMGVTLEKAEHRDPAPMPSVAWSGRETRIRRLGDVVLGRAPLTPRLDPWTLTGFRSWLFVPYGAVIALAAVLPIARAISLANRRARAAGWRRAGRCPMCGYDVRATPERCPECGTLSPAGAPSGPEE
jgi:hypothetical protein